MPETENHERVLYLSNLMGVVLAELSNRTGMTGSLILSFWLEKISEIEQREGQTNHVVH